MPFKVRTYIILIRIPIHGIPTVHYGTVQTLKKQKWIKMKTSCCEVSRQIPNFTVNKSSITLRLGRPCTILITAGSSNIWPLPSPRLCPLPLPCCPGGARGRYCSLCLGGEGEPWWDGGLRSGGGGVGGGGGGGSPN